MKTKAQRTREYILTQRGTTVSTRNLSFTFIRLGWKDRPSRSTISAALRDLEAHGIIDRWGKGKGTRYYIRRIDRADTSALQSL